MSIAASGSNCRPASSSAVPGELFLRVGEVFPHPDLRFSQAFPAEDFADLTPGRLVGAGQHKDLSGLAQGAALTLPSCHGPKATGIIPGGFQLGAEYCSELIPGISSSALSLQLPQRATRFLAPL